jgi:hypothetical protein
MPRSLLPPLPLLLPPLLPVDERSLPRSLPPALMPRSLEPDEDEPPVPPLLPRELDEPLIPPEDDDEPLEPRMPPDDDDDESLSRPEPLMPSRDEELPLEFRSLFRSAMRLPSTECVTSRRWRRPALRRDRRRRGAMNRQTPGHARSRRTTRTRYVLCSAAARFFTPRA